MRFLILFALLSCATEPLPHEEREELDPEGLRPYVSPVDQKFLCGSPVLRLEQPILPYGLEVCRWVRPLPDGEWSTFCPPPQACKVTWRGHDFPPNR